MTSQLCLIIDSRSYFKADAIVEDLNVPPPHNHYESKSKDLTVEI